MDYEKNNLLKEYVTGFDNFEKFIKQNNLNYSLNFEKHFGFLINFTIY